MEGQLFPAQARVHSAVRTARPNATIARNETRTIRRARGETRTRCRKLSCRRAMPQASRLRGPFPAGTIRAYERPSRAADRPRVRLELHPRARRAPPGGADDGLCRVRSD